MDPMTLGALISGGTSLLGNLFGDDEYNGPDPAQILAQVHQMGKETFDPYIQRGHTAQDKLSGHYNRMSDNPMDFLNQIIAGYKPSEGYKFREKNALNAARNAAAAGGISGTNNDQFAQAELVNGLLGDDMQQWLQNVLGIQGTGLGGLENVAGRGFGASQSLADLLANVGGSQAGLAYNRQQADRDRTGNLLGGLSGLLGTAGTAIGKTDWFKNLGGNKTGNTVTNNARNNAGSMPGTMSLTSKSPISGSIYGAFR